MIKFSVFQESDKVSISPVYFSILGTLVRTVNKQNLALMEFTFL